jgi:hypothetical protein
MNAYELADKLDEYNKDGMPVYVVGEAVKLLRKQADRIVELEVYEKQMQKIKTRRALLDFILDPEKENT